MQFKLAVYAVDTTRPVTGNTVQTPYLGNRFVDGFASALDVQSFSCKQLKPLVGRFSRGLAGGERESLCNFCRWGTDERDRMLLSS